MLLDRSDAIPIFNNAPLASPLRKFKGQISLPGLHLSASRPGEFATNFLAESTSPVLGKGSASRLMIHHSSYIAGSVGRVALFPETSSALIVLANSAGSTDTMRLISQILVELLFEN